MPELKQRGKVVVLGAGNELMRDEGIGVHVIRALQRQQPDGWEAIEAGTSPDILCLLGKIDKLVIVDAVKGGGQPGAIYRFGCDQLSQGNMPISSIHQWGLAEELNMMELLGISPRETVIIGVEPEQVDWGLEPSPTLEKRIPDIAALVLRELAPEKL